ncbi:MAG TPA: antibiotic biosynthesis monooxygenase [Planctomycetaceae bacterium]|nr:antibiotic biosynthesis monooxygenase [Planctomycetaceae bacterium]
MLIHAMIYLYLWIHVTRSEDISLIAGHLARCTTLSRQETGCEKYEVYHSQRDPQRFLIVEHWTSQADWDRHRTGRAFLEIYQPEIMPRVTREPHVCDLVPAQPV